MRWLIDSDILIEGERGNPLFEAWSRSEAEFATADVIRTEFLLGVHAVADSANLGQFPGAFRCTSECIGHE